MIKILFSILALFLMTFFVQTTPVFAENGSDDVNDSSDDSNDDSSDDDSDDSDDDDSIDEEDSSDDDDSDDDSDKKRQRRRGKGNFFGPKFDSKEDKFEYKQKVLEDGKVRPIEARKIMDDKRDGDSSRGEIFKKAHDMVKHRAFAAFVMIQNMQMRVDKKISHLEEKGYDLSVAQEHLDKSEAALADAKEAQEKIASIFTGATADSDKEALRAEAKKYFEEVKASLKIAHQSLKDAVKAIRDKVKDSKELSDDSSDDDSDEDEDDSDDDSSVDVR